MYRFLKCGLLAAAVVGTPVAADAADAARPYRYQSPIYDWNGFYVGAHVGVASSDGASGVLGGGQAGYNYQFGQWVVGVEGQFSLTSISESVSMGFYDPWIGYGSVRAEANVDWISTLALRAGWAFDRWLVYGKLGGAWAHTSVDVVGSWNYGGARISGEGTSSGIVIGIGSEYALRDNWTGKVEYNVMDFDGGAVHALKAGVNYRFGSGPRRY